MFHVAATFVLGGLIVERTSLLLSFWNCVLCVSQHRVARAGTTNKPEVFVQALDSCFENVCELDLIYHFDRAGSLAVSGASESSSLVKSSGELHPG